MHRLPNEEPVKTPEVAPVDSDLRRAVVAEVERDPVLIPDYGVELRMASPEYAEAMAALYKSAYERGDYFAGRFDDPEQQVFSPDWQAWSFQNSHNLRFIFSDSSGELLGATGFFHDRDSYDGTPLLTSDETQIAPYGRGLRIMDRFFERIVPILESSGAGIVTDFVLTPESKGLRRTLQADLGMVALGIHPNALYHRRLAITRSEISAAKYPSLTAKPTSILPEFEPLYRIVQAQLPLLPEPAVVPTEVVGDKSPHFTDQPAEVVRQINATDPESQKQALVSGWVPVEFDPDSNVFKVAQIPPHRPDLEFIFTNEDIAANQMLVTYLNEVLYGTAKE